MRTLVIALLLVTAGCGIKKKEDPPEAVLEPGGTITPAGSQSTPVVGMKFGKLWEPVDETTDNLEAEITRMLAEQNFAAHQSEYLAPTIVGSVAGLGHSGWCVVAIPPTVSESYPGVAKKFEAKWKNGLVRVSSVSGASLDMTSNIGSESTRTLIFRVKGGTDELRKHFGDYITRVESALNATGVAITAHQRGGIRETGSLSDIRYEIPTRKGSVRSVIVRGYDKDDVEFNSLMLEERKGFGGDGSMVKSALKKGEGPYLVVYVKEQRQ